MHLTTLADRAMLVRVKIGTYSPYAYDAEATERAYGHSKVGRANKHLLKESTRLKQTNDAYNATRAMVNKRTSPWMDEGVRLFKNEEYMDLVRDLGAARQQADSLANDLTAHWDWEVNQDFLRFNRVALNNGTPNVFDPSDYPTAQQIKDKFYCQIRYMPVPDTGDFRVELGAEQVAAFEESMREAEQAATQHALVQMTEPVVAMLKKLTEYAGEKGQRWHDSLISNVVEVTKRIRHININNDPTIYAMAKELETFILPYSFAPSMLKDNPDARAVAKQQLDAVANKMRAYMGGV